MISIWKSVCSNFYVLQGIFGIDGSVAPWMGNWTMDRDGWGFLGRVALLHIASNYSTSYSFFLFFSVVWSQAPNSYSFPSRSDDAESRDILHRFDCMYIVFVFVDRWMLIPHPAHMIYVFVYQQQYYRQMISFFRVHSIETSVKH